MYSDALFSKTRSVGQIAYMAQHFKELQGFRYIPFWTAWFFLSVFSEIGRLSEVHYQRILIGGLIVFCAAWTPWIKRWYRLRYGTVLPSARKSNKWTWLVVGGWLIFSIATEYHPLAAYKDSQQLGPIILFCLPSALHLPSADLATRFRFAMYTFVMLSVLVLIAFSPVLDLHVESGAGWRLRRYGCDLAL